MLPHQLEEKLFMVSTQTVYHKITKSFWGPVFSINQERKFERYFELLLGG